jgi:putative transposase
VIDRLVDAGAPVDRCCRILGVARQSYYKHKRTPTTPRQLRRSWVTGLIREVHVASRGTYGYRRVHAELTMGMGIQVCSRTVSVLMTQAGIDGLPGPVRVKRLRGIVTVEDLVNRKFHRLRPDELWVTDITQHRTREGWVYCARSWTRSAAGSWAGPSTHGSTPPSWSTRWTWPSATAA